MRRSVDCVTERNVACALASTQLGCGGGTRRFSRAVGGLACAHVECAPLLDELRRHLRHRKYRLACTTLERLSVMLYNRSLLRTNTEEDKKKQTEAVRDFVRLGGVSLLRRVLWITDDELNAAYAQRESAANSSSNLLRNGAGAGAAGAEDNFIVFIAQLIGWGLDAATQHENMRRQRQQEEEEERREQQQQQQQQRESSTERDRAFLQHQRASQERQRQASPLRASQSYDSDEDGMEDPPLQPFSREEQEDVEMEEYDSDPEEDVYRMTSQDETGIVRATPASRITERLINHPRYTNWLKQAMFKYCIMLLRESAYVVQSQSDFIVKNRRDLDLLCSLLMNSFLFFTVTPLLEEVTAFHLGACPISSIGLPTNLFFPPYSQCLCMEVFHFFYMGVMIVFRLFR